VKRPLLVDAAVFVALVGLAVATRLVMFEPNFHAVTAATLFAGFYFRSRLVASLVPLIVMTASDRVIGGYAREVMITVYLCMMLPIAWRAFLRNRLTVPRLAFVTVASTLIFYVVTNAAVFYAVPWYGDGWDGLVACYTAAVPFLYNSLAGDLFFTGGIFGAYALATRLLPASAPAPAVSPVSA
jgi:hypothetical protein